MGGAARAPALERDDEGGSMEEGGCGREGRVKATHLSGKRQLQ